MSRCQWCGSLTDSAGCLNITCSANQVVRDEVATLRAENARLREALTKYGQHPRYCTTAPCTCGLTAALTGGPHE